MSANLDTFQEKVKSELFGLHQLADAVEDEYLLSEGEETEVARWLEDLQSDQLEDTTEALCRFVDEVNGRHAKMDLEKKRIREAEQLLDARASWAFRRLRAVVEKFGEGPRKKISAGPYALALRKSTRLEIDPNLNTLDLPEKFQRYKDPEPRKDELKRAIKAGEIVEGVALVDHFKVEVKNG
jgi:hypothetical protein